MNDLLFSEKELKQIEIQRNVLKLLKHFFEIDVTIVGIVRDVKFSTCLLLITFIEFGK